MSNKVQNKQADSNLKNISQRAPQKTINPPKKQQQSNNNADQNKNEAKVVKKVRKGLFAIIQQEYQKEMGVTHKHKLEQEQLNESEISFLTSSYKQKPKEAVQQQKEEKNKLKKNLSALIQAEYQSYMGKQPLKQPIERNSSGLMEVPQKQQLKKDQQNYSKQLPKKQTHQQISYLSVPKKEKQIVSKNLSSRPSEKLAQQGLLTHKSQIRAYQKTTPLRPEVKTKAQLAPIKKTHNRPHFKNEQKQCSQQMFPSILKNNISHDHINVAISPPHKKVTFEQKSRVKTEHTEPKSFANKYDKYDRLVAIQKQMSRKHYPQALDEEILQKVKINPKYLEQKSQNLTQEQKKQYIERAAQEIRTLNFSSSLKNKISNLRNKNPESPKVRYQNVVSPLYKYLS